MQKISLIFLLISLCLSGQANINDGLVVKYTFNGTLHEEIRNHIAKAEGVFFVSDRFGNSRSSCYLQGNVNSYINLGTNPVLKPQAGSISLWINIDMVMFGGTGIPVNPIILTKNDTISDFFEGYALYYNYLIKKVVASAKSSQRNSLSVHSTDTLALNRWHHLVFTFDDSSIALYIDGVLDVKLEKNFKSRYNPNDSVLIGSTGNAKNQRFLCGSVDDIFIYNRVISPDEVTELYNAPDPNASHIYIMWFKRAVFFLLIIIVLLLLFIRWHNARIKNEREKIRIIALHNELETKAIRSQMNPHFIFNSLNTLQSFILEEDIAKSNLYLSKLALLIRRLLESGHADHISLAEEIEILEGYLEIEKLRFNQTFNYKIESEISAPEKIHIPFMLIQPFVENAVWHGLLSLNGERTVTIKFTQIDAQRLLCIVDDNGVGRSDKPASNPFKKKSLATEFIVQRMEILEKSLNISCGFKIIDKLSAQGQAEGTSVHIVIPILK